MMKLKYLCGLLLLGLTACSEEQLSTYEGNHYVHFTPMEDDKPQLTVFNFATQAPLTQEGEVEVGITLWGFQLEQDAACRVSAVNDKTTAIEGTDYATLQPGVVHQGVPTDTYCVTVYRNAELLNTDYTLTLCLDEVDGCKVGPMEYRYATLQVTDRVTQPKWWEQSVAANLGKYSDLKYRVFIIFMDGKILESLDAYTGIEFVRLIADFKSWWKTEWEKGNYHYYDADGQTPLYETIIDAQP